MYAGPFGFLGSNSADTIVAIRLGLLTKATDAFSGIENALQAKKSANAGVGVVPGSTGQVEWSETGYKLGVMSSQFAQSPLTLKNFETPKRSLVHSICRGAYQIRCNSIFCLSCIKVDSIAGSFGTSTAFLIVLARMMKEAQHFEL